MATASGFSATGAGILAWRIGIAWLNPINIGIGIVGVAADLYGRAQVTNPESLSLKRNKLKDLK